MKKAKVVTIGPDINSEGGISAVLRTYAASVPGFRFMPTNSRRGSLAGAVVFALTLLGLPFLRLGGYNTVHAHGASGKSFFRKNIALSWARLWGFRTIFHNHGGGFIDFATPRKEKVGAALRKCSAVIVLTDAFNRFFRDELGCGHVETLPNPVVMPDEEICRDKVAGDGIVDMLFLGKICRAKGVFDLLEAINRLPGDKKKRVCLHLAGKGDIDALAVKFVELAAGRANVVYEGSVSGKAKDALLRKCRVMILPSYVEGLPITLLEAGAYGMASIASNVGGIPQLVTDSENGIIIEPGQIDALADAICTYIDRPDRLLADSRAARRMAAPYAADAIAARLDKIYHTLL